MTSRFYSEFNCEKSSFFEVFRIWVNFGFTFTLDPLVEFLWLELTVELILMIPISIQNLCVKFFVLWSLFRTVQSYLTVAEDTSVILVAILEEACARILLIDTIGLSDFGLLYRKVSSRIGWFWIFKKKRLSLKPKFSARCRRRTNHICEPIRKQ